jgi:uncharacterized membrane protein
MTEATVVNLATVVRVLLVGGIFMVLPLITRKGLLFGAYVGEQFAERDAARRLVRGWYRGCLAVMASALVVGLGISLVGAPIVGNITATAILLFGCGGLYLRMYYTARRLAPPDVSRQADISVALLDDRDPRGTTLAKVSLGICVLAGLATVVHAMVSYEAMPDRLPIHFGLSGEADGWFGKSIVTVMLVPTANLVICPFVALIALLTARAKRSFRGGSGGQSVEAQNAFRATMAMLLSGMALFTCALLTFLSVQMVRVGLSEIRSIGVGIWWILGAMLVFMFGGLIRIMAAYGQGGALIENGSAEAPLTNGLADNAHWYWGVFYVNKDDPSILVEKRFGIGYAVNLGNPRAVAIFGTFLVLVLGLATLGLIAALN